jgi:adenylate kinase
MVQVMVKETSKKLLYEARDHMRDLRSNDQRVTHV